MNDIMDDKYFTGWLGFVIGCISALLLLAYFGHHEDQQIIDHGAAQYSPTTGDFEWLSGNVYLKGEKNDD